MQQFQAIKQKTRTKMLVVINESNKFGVQQLSNLKSEVKPNFERA